MRPCRRARPRFTLLAATVQVQAIEKPAFSALFFAEFWLNGG
jgi:hypothetical protein